MNGGKEEKFVKKLSNGTVIGHIRQKVVLDNTTSAVDSFLNPGVFIVIAKLQKVEIRLRLFTEPPNSGGALAPAATPLSKALM